MTARMERLPLEFFEALSDSPEEAAIAKALHDSMVDVTGAGDTGIEE